MRQNKYHPLVLLFAVASLLFFLTGCVSVGPKYVYPGATAVPANYASVPPGWKMAAPRANLPKGKWWEIFGHCS